MLLIVMTAVVLAAAVPVAARMAFDRRISREIDALLADAQSAGGRIVSDHDIERLPEPVQRWLRYAHVVGTAVPTTVRLRQNGQFRLEGRGWTRFVAQQYFTIAPPGFLWKATFPTAPMLSVTGRDQYRAGEGSLDRSSAAFGCRSPAKRDGSTTPARIPISGGGSRPSSPTGPHGSSRETRGQP